MIKKIFTKFSSKKEINHKFINKLGKYKIKDPELFDQFFTHRSWKKSKKNNERLEFLGDAVLNLISSELLMKKQPSANEGELSKNRSLLVNGKTLAKIAIDLGFPSFLKTESHSHKTNHRLLAGALEAYIGAFYLENSFPAVKKMVETLFKKTILNRYTEKNYKSLLQEWCHKKYKTTPTYRLKKEEGVGHKKIFFIEVLIQDKVHGIADSQKKKHAEQKAAYQALQNLNISLEEETYKDLI